VILTRSEGLKPTQFTLSKKKNRDLYRQTNTAKEEGKRGGEGGTTTLRRSLGTDVEKKVLL